MAQVTAKMEILVDLSKPADEIISCIAAIANAHPGKQQEILHGVDLWLGQTLAKVEEQTSSNEDVALKDGDPK